MKNHPTYEVLEQIGRGNAATVYRAHDLALRRYVAIKELDEKLHGDPRQMEHFWEEAQFLANLKHDNIVQIHGLDKERGWIIMELMKGSLDAKVAEGPLPPDLVRSVLRQVLSALDTLHGLKKLHGGVKPANLLIDEHGRVKLSDSAGIALTEELRRPTGSAKYLAPELLNPEFGEVSTQVDLYCLGLTALEMLKGPSFDKLFKGVGGQAGDPELGWMRWHSSSGEVLPPVKELLPSVPPDLAIVVDKLLKKHATERYATAGAALKDLENKPLVLVQPARGGAPRPAPAAGGGVVQVGAGPRPPAASPKTAPAKGKNGAGKSGSWLRRHPILTGCLGLVFLGCSGIFLLVLALVLPSSDTGVEMTLETDPPGTTIRLNGADVDKPAPTPLALQSGANKLWLKVPGYEDKKLLVTVTDEDVEILDDATKKSEKISRKGKKTPIKVAMTPLADTPVTASLTVTTDPPGARVTLNKEAQTQTTNNTFTVKFKGPGKFPVSVEVAKDGHQTPKPQTVELVHGDKQTVNFNLSPGGGSASNKVRLTGLPDNAQVTVNGKAQPKGEFDLPPGGFRLQVTVQGYKAFDRQIKPEEIKNGVYNVTLVPLSERPLEITTRPQMAKVFVKGQPQDQLTDGKFQVPSGPFELRLALKGYRTEVRSVPADQDRVDVELTKLSPGKREMFISSNPQGGSVWIDGAKQSQPTNNFFEVPEGPFKLKVELNDLAGHKDVTNETELNIALNPLPAEMLSLWLETTPPRAKVYIDGKLQDKLTNDYFLVPARKFKLQIVLPDGAYMPEQVVDGPKDPRIKGGHLYIEKANPATLLYPVILNTVSGAKVYVDGKPVEVGADKKLLVPKKFELRVEGPGYFPFKKALEAPTDGKLDIDLDPEIRLVVSANPPDAAIKLNGEPVDDPAKLVVRPGTYKLTAEKDGFGPAEEVVVLAKTDKERTVKLQLPLLTASRYALVMGVHRPTKDLPEFVYAGSDVAEFARVLRAGGYDADKVAALVQGPDREPTAKDLRAGLDLLLKKCQLGDIVVVALAGHAVRFNGGKDVYYCPAGSNLADKSTLVSLGEVFQALGQCKAKTKVVLLDLWRADAAEPPALPNGVSRSRPKDVEPVPGLAMLLSCSDEEMGQEHLGPLERHGAFFDFVLRGLMGAAGNGDGKVTLRHLEEYLANKVPGYIQKRFGTPQSPKLLDNPNGSAKELVLVQRKALLDAVYRGLTALEQDQGEAAQKALAAAPKEGEDFFPELFILRAAAQYMLGTKESYNNAVEECNKALKLDPGNAKAWSFLGEIRLELAEAAKTEKAYAEALQCHDKAINHEPGCGLAYRARGLVYESMARALGMPDLNQKALADYNEAVRWQPRQRLALVSRAVLNLYVLEKTRATCEEAVKDLDRAIQLDARDALQFYYRGVARHWLGNKAGGKETKDFDAAIKDFTQAIDLDGKVPEFWNFRGVCQAAVGEYDRAIDDYSTALTLQGKSPSPQVLVNRGIAYHEKAAKLPDTPERRKLLTTAVADYQAALKINPNLYTAYDNLSRTYTALGDAKQAEQARKMAEKIKMNMGN
jgi:serine/threonine-protein kinase